MAAPLETSNAQGTLLPAGIKNAFAKVSGALGTSFSFLMQTAKRESNFQLDAKAPTSSATGPFQFIEQTWLETLAKHGPSMGLGSLSSHIEQTSGGQYSVQDSAMRERILNLRKDPAISAAMAAAYANDNASHLQKALERPVTEAEVYLAHFMGPSGAEDFLKNHQSRPDRLAAYDFPAQAQANKTLFFDGNAKPRSYGDLYSLLTKDHSSRLWGTSDNLQAFADSGHTTALSFGQGNNSSSQDTVIIPDRATSFSGLFASRSHDSLFASAGLSHTSSEQGGARPVLFAPSKAYQAFALNKDGQDQAGQTEPNTPVRRIDQYQ
jgi:hypothetical protein